MTIPYIANLNIAEYGIINFHFEEFALYTGRSLASFKRDFAEISELSPQKWIIEKRLNKAHELISQGKSVTDAYIETGFKNRSHFSTAFKNRFGYPPNKIAN